MSFDPELSLVSLNDMVSKVQDLNPEPHHSTGAVSFWNADDRHLEEDSKIHRTVINMIAWNASGERLATGDDNGRVSHPELWVVS